MWIRRSSTLRPRALHEHSILRHLPHALHTAIVQLRTTTVNLREEGASEQRGGSRASLYNATLPHSHSYLDPSASRKRTVLSPKHSVFSAITVENCGVSLSNAAWPKQKYTHIARTALMGAGRYTRDQVHRFPYHRCRTPHSAPQVRCHRESKYTLGAGRKNKNTAHNIRLSAPIPSDTKLAKEMQTNFDGASEILRGGIRSVGKKKRGHFFCPL